MIRPRPAIGRRGSGIRSSQRWIRHWSLVLTIVAVGLLVRFHRIGSQGLWIDEAFSIWLARRPLGEMLHWVAEVDQHPPLYYALLHGWTEVFGDSEASARSLSALFGSLTIPVVYLLGRRLSGEKVGLLAALILAVSPFHVRFAQEARMYTLLALNVSLGLYAVTRLLGAVSAPGLLERRAGRLCWIAHVACTGAALWTHNTAIFFPVGVNLFVFSHLLAPRLIGRGRVLPHPRRSRFLRHWILAQAAILLLWLPWFPAFVSQAIGVYRRFWLPAPSAGTAVSVIGVLLCDSLPLPLVGTATVSIALAGLVLHGFRQLLHRSACAALLGAVITAPVAGQWLGSLWRPILCARTLIWVSIPLYLLLGIGLSQIGKRSSSRACFAIALGAVLAVNGIALCGYYQHLEKEQWDEAAALVAEHAQPGDLILFNDAWGQIPFDYYLGRQYNPPVVEHGVPEDLFDSGILEPEMTEGDLPRLRALVRGRERVWLIYSHAWYTDPRGLVPSVLEEELIPVNRWGFSGVRVLRYGSGSGGGAENVALGQSPVARSPAAGCRLCAISSDLWYVSC